MTNHFNTHIDGLDLDFWHDLINRHGETVEFNNGDYICRQGEHNSILGYVKSGYFIYGSERGEGDSVLVGGFAFPEALLGNYPDCMYNGVSPFSIRAGRRGEAVIMDAQFLPSYYDSDPIASRQGRLLMESAYRSLQQRYHSLYAKTPAQRYLDLITRHPQILQDLPQKEIASYLQITPVHLCRIRKSLLKPPAPTAPSRNHPSPLSCVAVQCRETQCRGVCRK